MVKHYSLKGDVICIYRCDEQSDDLSLLFNRPDALTQNRNKDICVVNRTDFDSGEVCIITEEGNFKSRYQGNGLTFDPCGICCDSKMNIIVSDYSNTCVHLLPVRVNFLLIYLHGTPCWGIPGVWEFTMIVCGWDVTEEELNDTDCCTPESAQTAAGVSPSI